MSYTVEEELNRLAEWSLANNLRLNQSKSQEIIFIAPGARRTLTILPDPIHGIKRLESIKVLVVIINDQLTTSDHVTELIATCAQTLCAIQTLKVHGLIGHALHTMFKATVQARLLYSQPQLGQVTVLLPTATVWSRFCKRLGYCDIDSQSVVEQFQLADETLSERVLNDDRRAIDSQLPPRTEYSYNLRRRWHDYELTAKTRTLNTNNFIARSLCYTKTVIDTFIPFHQ